MGVIYAKGRGVDVDEDKAIQFYEKAALGGLDRAQYVYATWLRDGKDDNELRDEANPCRVLLLEFTETVCTTGVVLKEHQIQLVTFFQDIHSYFLKHVEHNF